MRGRCYAVLLTTLLFALSSVAREPDLLPGNTLSEADYIYRTFPSDSIEHQVPETSPSSQNWLDRAAATWEAPPLVKQMAQDRVSITLGKGALFIPSMALAELDPNIEIRNVRGKTVAEGKPGCKYVLLPGTYLVLLGSGTDEQRMVRKVEIIENRTAVIIPNWCTLNINVLNTNNVQIKGEYELARIDDFEAHGRGYGTDPEQGGHSRNWVVRPGLYKIFSVGSGYNTRTNFVTVRLLPGEYTRFVLVQDSEAGGVITAGGIVNTTAWQHLSRNWQYGLDIGGSGDFNVITNRLTDTTETATSISVLLNTFIKYKKQKVEWDSRFRLDEGLTFSGTDLLQLDNFTDDLRLTSLLTWRYLPWVGPYIRLESGAELFAEYKRVNITGGKHYFMILDQEYVLTEIDSLSSSYQTQPPGDPLNLEAGFGVNINLYNSSIMELQLLAGFGFQQKSSWGEAEVTNFENIEVDSMMFPSYARIVANENATVIRKFDPLTTRPELGPEATLNTRIQLGRLARVESELKTFFSFNRITRPDFDWWLTLGWRLSRMVTLDYQFSYNLRQSEEEAGREDDSRHRVLLRFTFAGQ